MELIRIGLFHLSLSPFDLTLGETPPEREATPQGAAMRMEAIVFLKRRWEGRRKKGKERKAIRGKGSEGEREGDQEKFFFSLFFVNLSHFSFSLSRQGSREGGGKRKVARRLHQLVAFKSFSRGGAKKQQQQRGRG